MRYNVFEGDITNKKVANITVIFIVIVWALCFFSMGFNGLAGG